MYSSIDISMAWVSSGEGGGELKLPPLMEEERERRERLRERWWGKVFKFGAMVQVISNPLD